MRGVCAGSVLVAMALASVGYAQPAGPTYEQVVASLNPLHWWRFNDAVSSPTVADSVADYDGTWTNGPNLVTGICDPDDPAIKIWNQNGPTWATFPHSDSLLLTEGTIAFCFIDTGKILASGILSKDSDGFDTGGHLTIGTLPGTNKNNGSLYVRLQDTTGSKKVTFDNLQVGNQHHLIFTFGPGGMKLYIDGQLVDSNGYTGGLLGNLEPMVLGASTAYSGNQTHEPLRHFWSGILDELMIYDYAFDNCQVQSLYLQQYCHQIPEPGTAALLALGAVALGRRRRAAGWHRAASSAT